MKCRVIVLAFAAGVSALAGCSDILGIGDFRVDSDAGALDDRCGGSEGERCGSASQVQTPGVKSPESCPSAEGCLPQVPSSCPYVLGAARDARSVHLGALLDLTGPQAAAGAVQSRSMELAIAELNEHGGVRLRGETQARPLTLFVCDLHAGAIEASTTLVEALGVSALIGPPASELFAQVRAQVAAPHGVVMLAPTALSGASLAGDDPALSSTLTWGLVPTEADRVPMLVAHTRALEARMRMQRGRDRLKIAFVMREDIPMTSVRRGLTALMNNGQLSQLDGNDLLNHFNVLQYAPSDDLTSVVSALTEQVPDIVLLDGEQEAIARIVGPLELALTLARSPVAPHYVLTESALVPELTELAASAGGLSGRLSVVAVAPMAVAQVAQETFQRAYQARYRVRPPAIKALAAGYDAVYVLAFALSASDADPLTRPSALASGMRQLMGGSLTLNTGSADLGDVLSALSARKPLTLVGTHGELSWTTEGTLRQGSVGTFCLGFTGDRWSLVETGYVYDVGNSFFAGNDEGCADMNPRAAAAESADPAAGAAKPAAPASPAMSPGPSAASASMPPMAADDASVPMLTDAAVADAGAAAEPERAMDVGLVVRYRALNTDPSDSVISFALQVVNRSASAPVPLSQLTLRYYFANEHPEVCPKECVVEGFYAGIQPAGQAISARRTHGADPDDPMRAYVEVTFPGSSIALGVGESVEVQQQFHTEPYRPLDERNDYSFRRVPDRLQEWDHVTLRQDGVLVWGVLPD